MAPRTRTTFKELQTVAIAEDVPELGVEAGTTGTVVTVYEGGRMLLVEIGREDGTSVGLVDLEVGEDGSPRPISSKRTESVTSSICRRP